MGAVTVGSYKIGDQGTSQGSGWRCGEQCWGRGRVEHAAGERALSWRVVNVDHEGEEEGDQ